MSPEAQEVLRVAESLVSRTTTRELCETCYTVIAVGEGHSCNVQERATAIMATLGAIGAIDSKRRAKGYGVR